MSTYEELDEEGKQTRADEIALASGDYELCSYRECKKIGKVAEMSEDWRGNLYCDDQCMRLDHAGDGEDLEDEDE